MKTKFPAGEVPVTEARPANPQWSELSIVQPVPRVHRPSTDGESFWLGTRANPGTAAARVLIIVANLAGQELAGAAVAYTESPYPNVVESPTQRILASAVPLRILDKASLHFWSKAGLGSVMPVTGSIDTVVLIVTFPLGAHTEEGCATEPRNIKQWS